MTIPKRQSRKQKLLLLELEKTPIVSTACHRAGVGRATYYRWREESDIFEDEADMALAKGQDLINDLAESQLIKQIQEGRPWAIVAMWLRHHHFRYFLARTKAFAPLPFRRPDRPILSRISKKFWP